MDKKIELENILKWILENRDDEKAMNDIAYTAYPHTSKYKSRASNNARNDISADTDIAINGVDV